MFPLEFPMRVLRRKRGVVLDPFCGRGTTNYAARILKLKSFGIDSSPVAVSIAKAKLASTSTEKVLSLAESILDSDAEYEIPSSDFWRLAFHPFTLEQICKLRSGLLGIPESDESVMLKAIVLGCLHGPMVKDRSNPSYLSNQMPRTFAPKPDYAVRYWTKNNLLPEKIDVRLPIRKKADRVLQHNHQATSTPSNIILGDSQKLEGFSCIDNKVELVVTSPPYYGMVTYVQDQWIRNWFIGGSPYINYRNPDQVSHNSVDHFIQSLGRVWRNIQNVAAENLRMVVRFGAIASRRVDYNQVLIESLQLSPEPWQIYRRVKCDLATRAKRQATHMGKKARSSAIEEMDYYIKLRCS